jgi:hypothetical protein
MASEDIETVARMLPFELGPYPLRVRQQRLEQALPDAFVVLRSEKIVGACWFLDAVTPQQRWFGAIKDHLIPPSRYTDGIFAVPGEKAAAWVLARHASDCLALRGVKSVVACINVKNQPSLVVSRLLGGKIVARATTHYIFGRRRIRVVPVEDKRALGEGQAA